MISLHEKFGDIDIYLFDQILRGRIRSGMRILDAGCGGGRNLVYLLREGYEVYGVDQDVQAIAEVRRMAGHLAPQLPGKNFQVTELEKLPYPDSFFDVAICNAVLHFARDDAQFQAMLRAIWRTVRTGGVFFSRLASSIGIEKQLQQISGRRFLLPDGSERYLVDAAMLEAITADLNGYLLDPIKTTIVHNQRSMTTWVMEKA